MNLISGYRILESQVAWEEGPGPYSALVLQVVRRSLVEVRSRQVAVEEAVGSLQEAFLD